MAAHAQVGIVGGGRQAGRRIGRRRIEQGERQSLAVVAQVAQRLAVVVIGQGRGRIATAVGFAIVAAAVAVVRMVLRSEGQAVGAGQEIRVGAQAGRQRVVQRRQGRLRIELLLLRRGIGRQHGHAVVASLELERQVARRQGRLRIEGQAVDVEHGTIGVQARGVGRAQGQGVHRQAIVGGQGGEGIAGSVRRGWHAIDERRNAHGRAQRHRHAGIVGGDLRRAQRGGAGRVICGQLLKRLRGRGHVLLVQLVQDAGHGHAGAGAQRPHGVLPRQLSHAHAIRGGQGGQGARGGVGQRLGLGRLAQRFEHQHVLLRIDRLRRQQGVDEVRHGVGGARLARQRNHQGQRGRARGVEDGWGQAGARHHVLEIQIVAAAAHHRLLPQQLDELRGAVGYAARQSRLRRVQQHAAGRRMAFRGQIGLRQEAQVVGIGLARQRHLVASAFAIQQEQAGHQGFAHGGHAAQQVLQALGIGSRRSHQLVDVGQGGGAGQRGAAGVVGGHGGGRHARDLEVHARGVGIAAHVLEHRAAAVGRRVADAGTIGGHQGQHVRVLRLGVQRLQRILAPGDAGQHGVGQLPQIRRGRGLAGGGERR